LTEFGDKILFINFDVSISESCSYNFGMPILKMTKDGKKNKNLPPSPMKARHAPSMKDKFKNRKEKPSPTIRVHAFKEPIVVEAYEYTLTATKCGFLNKYRLWTKGELEVDELTEANFGELKNQRDKDVTGNEYLKNDDGYARVWMIRYPPENESTVATRNEGLLVLKRFFLSKKATDFPPATIKVVDCTNVDDYPVLESFFLDDDIEEIFRASLDVTAIDDDFYEKFTAVARTIYLHKEPSAFAKNELGFPSLGA
jgi:hypothetical protein